MLTYGTCIPTFRQDLGFHAENTETEAGCPEPVEHFVPLTEAKIGHCVEPVDCDDEKLTVEGKLFHVSSYSST